MTHLYYGILDYLSEKDFIEPVPLSNILDKAFADQIWRDKNAQIVDYLTAMQDAGHIKYKEIPINGKQEPSANITPLGLKFLQEFKLIRTGRRNFVVVTIISITSLVVAIFSAISNWINFKSKTKLENQSQKVSIKPKKEQL